MEREIKFRAWDEKLKMMTSPFIDFLIFKESENFRKGQVLRQNFEDEDFVPTEIMQFTGLKDKKGKEIYEGDIVKLTGTGSRNDGTLFRIGFRMGSFEMQNDDDEPPLSFIYMAVQLRRQNLITRDYLTMNYIEVIGNIYENPELL